MDSYVTGSSAAEMVEKTSSKLVANKKYLVVTSAISAKSSRLFTVSGLTENPMSEQNLWNLMSKKKSPKRSYLFCRRLYALSGSECAPLLDRFRPSPGSELTFPAST